MIIVIELLNGSTDLGSKPDLQVLLMVETRMVFPGSSEYKKETMSIFEMRSTMKSQHTVVYVFTS